MAIEQKKMLQLLRGKVVTNKAAAISGIKGLTFPEGVKFDGTPVVGRYYADVEKTVIKSVYGIFHEAYDGKPSGVTIFDNADEVAAEIKKLQDELDTVESNVGLAVDGKHVKTEGNYTSDAETVVGEIAALDDALKNTNDAIGAENDGAVKGKLKDTTYAKNGATEDGETVIDAIKALDDAIVANKVASEDNSIVITTATTGTNLSVNVDDFTIVNTTSGISTAVKIQYVKAFEKEDGTKVAAHIALMDNADTELSTVNVSDLIGNGQLVSSSYDETTGILTLTFQQADGTTKDVEVDLKAMLDIDDVVIGDESKDYLDAKLTSTIKYVNKEGVEITKEQYDALSEEEKKNYHRVGEQGIQLDVKKGIVAKPGITEDEAQSMNAKHLIDDENGKKPGEEGYITTYEDGYVQVEAVEAVPATTGLATSEDVSKAIADEVALLEEAIEELQANSLTSVSVNGLEAAYNKKGCTTHVAVTINGDDIKVASAYTQVEFAKEFATKLGDNAIVTNEDKVSRAFEKVENEIKVLVDEVIDNEQTTEAAVEALADSAGLLNEEGVISYTIHTTDTILKDAKNLDEADLALANEIRKVEAKNTTVVDALEGNTETLGAHITSDTDETTKATTYHVDVNFDFGVFGEQE